MKNLATIVCLGIIGFAQAQTTEKEVEIYERYENGELVEQRQSATENGKPIKDFDFEEAKREMQLKSAKLEEKMKEMEGRFEETRQRMEASMQEKMQQMEKRMADFEKKSEEMHQRMDQRMKEMESKRKEKKDSKAIEAPSQQEKPVAGEELKDVKFT